MKLPNPERAIVELAKLSDYCLDPRHESGKHKARVFAAALGLGKADAEVLRAKLLEAAFAGAELTAATEFGALYVVDFYEPRCTARSFGAGGLCARVKTFSIDHVLRQEKPK